MSLSRIRRELIEIESDETFEHSAGPHEENMYMWKAMLKGPEGSPYHNGIFELDIHFPTDYPFKSPKVSFQTKNP